MDFAFDDQVQFRDEGAGLPQAEPFPTGAQQQRSSSQAAEDEESESAEAAMHRRHRPVGRARALPFDKVQELRSAELTSWKERYTANMAEAQQSKAQHRAPFLAKKKAFDWVLGSGIGGVGDAFPSMHEKNLLNMFTGDSMLEMITGVRPSSGRKRGRDEESAAATDSETRRKRLQEAEGGEIGRGDVPPFQDGDMGFQGSDVSTSYFLNLTPAKFSTSKIAGHRNRAPRRNPTRGRPSLPLEHHCLRPRLPSRFLNRAPRQRPTPRFGQQRRSRPFRPT